MNQFLNTIQHLHSALLEPKHMTSPAPWAGHTPFAMWLVGQMRPDLLVELGAYSGISYLAFCQAVADQGIKTKCYAVDTWVGDEHAGLYGEHIYSTLRENHDPYYSHFSKLVRKTFDDAVAEFSNNSIDLLHIDGLHTYDAVKHDFDTWFPKLSDRAIVLFHDTEVRRDDFGVWRFWSEITKKYPGFSFSHSHGLGVLFVGRFSQQPFQVLGLDPTAQECVDAIKSIFQVLGAAQERRAELHGVSHALREITCAYEEARSQLAAAKGSDVQYQQQLSQSLMARLSQVENEKTQLQEAVASQHNWIAQQDETIRSLERALESSQSHLIQQQSSNSELREVIQKQHSWILQQDEIILAKDRAIGHSNSSINKLQRALNRSVTYRFYRVLKRAKSLLDSSHQGSGVTHKIQRMRNALRYLVRGDFSALRERAAIVWRERHTSGHRQQLLKTDATIGIYTTPHTLFVAHAVEAALAKLGLSCHIITNDESTVFPLDFYFVICAQVFKNLPPGEKRIVFQMEQSVSDRWFDGNYLQTLENSLAVFEYAVPNLAYLAGRGIAYPHVFYVPIGSVANYRTSLQQEATNTSLADRATVLFYGDPHVPRRQEYLEELKRHFKVRVISNLFGGELQAAIAQAAVVVNIHYYEGALLESTRIFECLSLGVRVVSESAVDVLDYPGLDSVVDFVPVGDVAAMVAAVKGALTTSPTSINKDNQDYLRASQSRFEFMFFRGLLALQRISYQQFQGLVSLPQGDSFALSLPETLERRAAYLASPTPGAQLFDGLRFRPGWIGCAMSYKFLCSAALKQGKHQLLICEDDVELPPDCASVMAHIHSYLDQNEGGWDIFVGLIAHLHNDVQVLALHEYEGMTFVTLDKMTSMVFNIYSHRALQLIANWDETQHNDQTNTIDRYLEGNKGLRIVTLLEPLFGHRDDQNSTLWGIGNEQYNSLIESSRKLLRKKVDEFKQQQAQNRGV